MEYLIFSFERSFSFEDFLHFAKILIKAQAEGCPDCRILSLGADEPTLNLHTANEVNKKTV